MPTSSAPSAARELGRVRERNKGDAGSSAGLWFVELPASCAFCRMRSKAAAPSLAMDGRLLLLRLGEAATSSGLLLPAPLIDCWTGMAMGAVADSALAGAASKPSPKPKPKDSSLSSKSSPFCLLSAPSSAPALSLLWPLERSAVALAGNGSSRLSVEPPAGVVASDWASADEITRSVTNRRQVGRAFLWVSHRAECIFSREQIFLISFLIHQSQETRNSIPLALARADGTGQRDAGLAVCG